jgi:hypothetical protein
MKKQIAWSHSSLKDFEGCARRYHEIKVLKNYPFTETDATRYGTQVHESLELYVRDGKPIPPEHLQFKDVVDKLMDKPGRKLPEFEMSLTTDLKPTEWKAKDVWVRGIADLLIIDDDNLTAWVVDYKTGNNKYPDREQLMLMSIMVFVYFPHIRKVNSALLFLVKNDMVRMQMMRAQADAIWWKYRERTARLEASFDNNVWNPNQTPLCGWCAVKTCEFNKKH